MLRTPDGELVILDFGLMTEITPDQKYGMIEAVVHLINRDYELIGEDFINLDFIPRGTDTSPIVPALARVFDAALAGGGAKSINFQELAADLAEITFLFPFRIPPYFALIIRAISVLEGIALVGNPQVRHISPNLAPHLHKSRRLASPAASLPLALPHTLSPTLTVSLSHPISRSLSPTARSQLDSSPSSTRPTHTSRSACSPTSRPACAPPCVTWSTARERSSTSTA